jgi:hypothetical protein
VTAVQDAPATEEVHWTRMSIRMLDELKAKVEARAQREGMDMSVWAREVLAAVVAANFTLEDLARVMRVLQSGEPMVMLEFSGEEPVVTPLNSGSGNGRQPGVRSLGASIVSRDKCIHPMHLRREMVSFDLCDCGKEFPR